MATGNNGKIVQVINGRWRFIFILLLSPILWWTILNATNIYAEWAKTPAYFGHKLNSIYSIDRLRYIIEARWKTHENARTDPSARLFYNKGTLLVDEFFNFTTFLSPRLYFGTMDGLGVETIPITLFPFWVAGILLLLSKKKAKPFLLLFVFAFIAYLARQKNLNFIFPIAFLNLYITSQGMTIIKDTKKKKIILIMLISYSTYILGRAIWLAVS